MTSLRNHRLPRSLLAPDAFDDYGPNGLQVPGRQEIQTIVTGVSANGLLLEPPCRRGRPRARPPRPVLARTAADHADPPPSAAAAVRARHALAAYHLPLDAHLEHGNNALLAARWAVGGAVRAAARRSAWPDAFAGDGIATDELAARVRERRAASRSRSRRAGPRPDARDRVRRRHRQPRCRDRCRPRRLPHRRARRARHESPPRPGSTSSPPATTRPRPSACAAWASCWPSLGIRHEFIDVPNPI